MRLYDAVGGVTLTRGDQMARHKQPNSGRTYVSIMVSSGGGPSQRRFLGNSYLLSLAFFLQDDSEGDIVERETKQNQSVVPMKSTMNVYLFTVSKSYRIVQLIFIS